MPAQQGITVENSFINGVVTEATALNFPDKAVTEADNCIFDIDGSVYRRTGFDLERNFTTKNINRDNNVIQTYLWQNVAGNGNVTVIVAQVGNTIYFWETDGTGIFSTGAQATTVTLTPVAGAPTPNAVEAQFTDGNGYLIVTHPYCEPMRIAYDIDAHAATSSNITIKVRDFEGAVATDPYSLTQRPAADFTTVNKSHLYNLLNQGWTETNMNSFFAGQSSTLPSNADVMWSFKNTSDVLDFTSATVNNVISGNTPAPRGHFVVNLSNTDRVATGNSTMSAAVFGAGSVPATTTGFQRPSACAFFAGRVFYAGINYIGFNSNIYFTQTLENIAQYGNCYQVNDPTAEELFDLLPTDGGVIAIPEAGTVYKMHTVPGGLCVFAANGVWFITGSTGLGFTATDYAILKIADIPSVSDTSFVNVGGFPAWWNAEGIYIIEQQQGNIPSVKSLAYDTFKTFYDAIPVPSKRYARGFFDKTDGVIRWLYREQATTNVNEIYEYDRVLNYNLRTNSFYPWTISPSDVKVHAITSTELITRPILINTVVDNSGDFVIDSLGNQVITFATAGSEGQQFDKYLVSYFDGTNFKFTFAERTDDTYLDWESYEDIGTDYTSYYITGYRLAGGGDRRVSNNWVDIFSRLDDPVEYKFQAIWDFANTGSGTGRWSSNQNVSHTDTNYGNARRRLKVRGHGKALQFRVSSVTGKPFDMLGWTVMQSINGVP